MSERSSSTALQSNNYGNVNRLHQPQSHSFVDTPYDFNGFVPAANSYELTESSSSGNSAGDGQFSFPVRHPSQSDIAGSPASSYAPSLSEGRSSISFNTPFKVPAVINQDRRTSSPAIHARNQQLSQGSTFTAPLPAQSEMQTAHWTPNFSFGNPSNMHETSQVQRYPDHYSQKQPQFGTHGRRASMAQDVPMQYNYDRRMSHPILPSTAFETSALQRQRQQSAVDWRSFAATNNVMRSGLSDSRFPGSDGLWNTLDSARGMIAMSHQDTSAAEMFKQNMARRSSIPYMPDSGNLSEDRGTDADGSSIFSRYSSIGSNEDPIAMQPNMAVDGTPDQASMMNTFSAKDNNSGHKKHVCPVCRKRFTRPSSLTTHIYSHTGEKPFTCEVEGCGRQFSVISNLRRHKKTHGAVDHDKGDSMDDLPQPASIMQPVV